jgi:hypothetical protein
VARKLFFAALVFFAACAKTPKSRTTSTTPNEAATSAASANTTNTASPVASSNARKQFKLAPDNYWRIDLPNSRRFDVSGLIVHDSEILIVADAIQTPFRLRLSANHTAAPEPVEMFTPAQLVLPLKGNVRARYDFEGLARDAAGRVYVCEEAQRLVLRYDPATQAVERLPIDWTPVRKYFQNQTANAAWEGIAVGAGKLWVANERDRPRIIELDLNTLQITADFAPEASFWGLILHYSDLCYFDDSLWVLLRHHRVVLQLDPTTHAVQAEYDYRALEDAPEHEYIKNYPTGNMEALAVDQNYIWLATDNNGLPRRADLSDTRPTLFRCRRPR